MRPRHGSSKYSSTRGRRQRSESGRQPPTRRGTNLNRASERDRCRALQMRDKGYPQGARTHNRHAQSMHVTSEASHQQPSRKMKLQWPLASSLSKRKPGIPHHAAACNVVNTGESNNTSSPSRACERVQSRSVDVGESKVGVKARARAGVGLACQQVVVEASRHPSRRLRLTRQRFNAERRAWFARGGEHKRR